jgi:DNA repair protein RadA/Sms
VYDRALPADAVLLGEIGLAGEIRPVSQAERRLAEAEKMGMGSAFLAERSIPRRAPKGLKCVGVQTVRELLERLFP